MHAVVSLLDEEHTRATKELWTELERDFGVRRLSVILPYPHYSYQVARQYDEQQLVVHTEELARRTAPFRVAAGGLALFTGMHPVLYIPVLRTLALSQFHQTVCDTVSPAGAGISPFYAPEAWVPHVTLAEHDLQRESLARIVARLYDRELFWEIAIDNLAIIWDSGTAQEVR
ncbi:MAG: 2'-5' RNA ligase family protein [Chloroflexota bacterium]|nr:2'-5' RNA ligase family protein [Chloroflexota bacterium]